VTLQNYEVEFEYIPGKKNTAADALSRNVASNTNDCSVVCNIFELITLDEALINTEQRQDETWKKVITYLENKVQQNKPTLPSKYKLEEFEIINNLYRVTDLKSQKMSRQEVKQLVIPHTLVSIVLKLVHDSPHSSHPGKDNTYKRAQLKYFWSCMRKDIYTYVDNCQTCAEIKGHTNSPAPLLSYPVPQKPWERVHLDTLELPMSENGYKYLLVAIDYFSRFCILQPMTNKKAETIASFISGQIICNFTTPKTIISDNGTEFNNNILEVQVSV